MIKNRVYFVHARLVNESGLSIFGGATIAWMVNEEGDIVIGKPAMCSKADRYVRSIGRDLAQANLADGQLIKIVPAKDVSLEAENVVRAMTGSQRVFSTSVLYEVLQAKIDESGVAAVMSTSWYEFLVREIIQLETNISRLEYTI